MSGESGRAGAACQPQTGDSAGAGTLPQPSGGFVWTQEPWGAALLCVPLSAVAPHLFTTGNLRLVDDDDGWAAIAARMGVAPAHVRLIRQVHGVAVALVRPTTSGDWQPPEADIVISDDPRTAIGVRVADCAPVLLADVRLGVVGAAHAGWRGTAKRAAAVAVDALRRTFGTNPPDLVAAIGPCLGPCCGEVGREVVEMFRDAGHTAADLDRWFASGGAAGRPYLDLWTANRDQLVRAGVPAPQIFTAEICTKTHMTLMHSYRAHGAGAGRMTGMIRARG
jgi:polyphenol oxidase